MIKLTATVETVAAMANDSAKKTAEAYENVNKSVVQAGRGFAVVADQIGKLAADSGASAVNTRNLIEKTLQEIEKGNESTIKTSEAFDKIIKDMEAFALVAKETRENAEGQARALEQVSGGIEQISGVVQNTAASAQESTAIGDQLSEQAQHLDRLVRRFKLFGMKGQHEKFEE